MLLPDSIHPQNSVYYTGAVLLDTLQQSGAMSITDLFVIIKQKNNMSFKPFLLSLDWLYLIKAAIVNEKGEVVLCS
ncbi:MAG: hypothetical protein IJ756_06545 [Paludibacteraceae bacterium]|nr:hypothetical protein [Paludibacteraceae bacterium]